MMNSEATRDNLTLSNRIAGRSESSLQNKTITTNVGAVAFYPIWWMFAVRGGLACAFGIVLLFSASLLGTLVLLFDPVLLVLLSVLLGSYVFGNAVLLGIAGIYGRSHRLPLWGLVCGEAVFAVALACYIAFSLTVTSGSLAWLAALHAVGTGCFQAFLAFRLRAYRAALALLASSSVLSLSAGALFLMHRHASVRTLALWLSGFELLFGALLVALGFWLHRQGSLRTRAESSGGATHEIG